MTITLTPSPVSMPLTEPVPSLVAVLILLPAVVRVPLLELDVSTGLIIAPDPVEMPLVAPDPVGAPGTLELTPDTVLLNLYAPPSVRSGGSDVVQIIPTTQKRARVYVHSPHAPRERLIELTTAFHIDRSFERMGPGHATFSVPTNDPQLTGRLLERGNLIVVQGDDVPDWAGTLITADGDLMPGTYQVNAQGIAANLDGRTVPQDKQVHATIGSHLVLREIIEQANARNPSGITLPAILNPGPEISELQSGGQSVLQALGELHDRTDWEWWIDTSADSKHVYSTMYWGQFQGFDYADRVHLWQNVHFSAVKYKIDLSKIMASLQVLGDFGVNLPLRNSVLRSIQKGPAATQAAARVELASAAAILALGDLPSGLRNESVQYEVMAGSLTEMARRAKKGLERPLNATEQFTIVINRRADWNRIRLGNFLTIHIQVQQGRPIERIIRVVGYQPDEEKGEIEVVCEVPIFR